MKDAFEGRYPEGPIGYEELINVDPDPHIGSVFTALTRVKREHANSHQFTAPSPPLARRLHGHAPGPRHAFQRRTSRFTAAWRDRGFDSYSGSWNSRHEMRPTTSLERFLREHRERTHSRYEGAVVVSFGRL
ncbi:hypothetical protein C9J85_02200 [Haloferax sp. wsp5]|nr:hypothetical protein C9J85_02200 [Haloferax sp. wsp5]